MEKSSLVKNEVIQRQESPLDVLSRAASMIQKEASGMLDNKLKEGAEKERNSDSGFEDNPSSPSKLHSPVFSSSSSKLSVHKEKRDKRQQERKSTSGAPGFVVKETLEKDTVKHEDDIRRLSDKSPPVICRNDCKECIEMSHKQHHAELSYHENAYRHLNMRDRIKLESDDHKLERCCTSEDEREHRIYRYPRIPPPPLISLHPHPFSWLPPPYPAPMSLMRRQSVITSASCPQQYSPDGVSLCPCIDPKCNIQAYPFNKKLKSPSEMKREVFTAVPPGFELPTVEEHFRKSLGSDYEELSIPVESLNSVDEHFAKALGSTWYNIKYKKCVDPSFRTRDRVLSGCNL